MSKKIEIEVYGYKALVGEYMPEDTKFKMNDSVTINRKDDPNNTEPGVISGIVYNMYNPSQLFYMVHFGHDAAGHDAYYEEEHLVKKGAGGRRRKSRKSRKAKKARKTRRRH